MAASYAELRDVILAKPWAALAVGFIAGAYVAADRTGAARRFVLSTLGAAVVGSLREVVLHPRHPGSVVRLGRWSRW